MDERKNVIREFEKNIKADTEGRNRLLADLGETILQRIADDDPFPEKTGNTPGAVLADYRKLQEEAAETTEIIKSLEADMLLLEELNLKISSGEGEQSGFEKELVEVYVQLGKLLLEHPGLEETTGSFKQQEEVLLAKIEEQEKKLEDLDNQGGGVLAWFGKNAQMALSRTLLLKNQSALQRLYRSTAEYFISATTGEELEGEAAEYSEKALTKKNALASVTQDLTALKTERRKIIGRSGADGSPFRRIQGYEKHISQINGEFPAVYLRLGSLAAENSGAGELSSFIKEEDAEILEKAKLFMQKISEKELEIQKIQAAINIDNVNSEIERIKKSIQGQQRKISNAEEAIAALEKQLAESEQHIEELEAFIKDNSRK